MSGPVEMLKRRRTKIIATLGPASADTETITRLITAGVNVVRLNMSHGDHDSHRKSYQLVRAAAHEARNPIGILADLCGPKIRVGRFAGGAVELVEGAELVVTTRDVEGGPGLVPSQWRTLHEEIGIGGRILLDDGRYELRVLHLAGQDITCTVVRGGTLKDRKGMNLPDAKLSAPALTDKDRVDAAFALDLGVDYLALSFVRAAEDVLELRELLTGESPPKIIAKIERPESLQHIEAIVDASDGIMVARGDLGVELPPEEVPVIQRQLIALARSKNKPSIVATQMLESMIESAQPTRAEVSDVSTAVFSGADAVMLSAETASGRHPVTAVEMMDRTARQAEAHMFAENRFSGDTGGAAPGSPLAAAIARSTAQLSRDLRLRAIVVLSSGGTATARVMSAARPGAPVVGAAATLRTMLQMGLLWGVIPRLVQAGEMDDPDGLARRLAVQLDLAEPGQRILCVEGFHEGTEADTPRLTVLTV